MNRKGEEKGESYYLKEMALKIIDWIGCILL